MRMWKQPFMRVFVLDAVCATLPLPIPCYIITGESEALVELNEQNKKEKRKKKYGIPKKRKIYTHIRCRQTLNDSTKKKVLSLENTHTHIQTGYVCCIQFLVYTHLTERWTEKPKTRRYFVYGRFQSLSSYIWFSRVFFFLCVYSVHAFSLAHQFTNAKASFSKVLSNTKWKRTWQCWYLYVYCIWMCAENEREKDVLCFDVMGMKWYGVAVVIWMARPFVDCYVCCFLLLPVLIIRNAIFGWIFHLFWLFSFACYWQTVYG